MFTKNQIHTLIGSDVYGTDDQKIGTVGQVYLDDQSDRPEWVTVRTGLFGTKESFVPLEQADTGSNGLRVPFTKDHVKDAPRIDADQGHLSHEEEAELYRHYGLDYNQGSAAPRSTTRGRGTVGHDTSGPETDDAMTRSEEHLKVGKETQEKGRARLRKHVVTEEQQVTVPVTREEVRVEREPITEANRGAALSGPDLSEEEHEVVLREERPVVEKETVPVERVKLGKEKVTDQEKVSKKVRKEQIDADGIDSER